MQPRDLADRMASAPASVKMTLPVAEARIKAREIINQGAINGITPVIENWHLVSPGQVEFTVRNYVKPD
jgi:hypothetical protein